MYFTRLIATRYLFSRTNLSATRWISIISAVAIGIVTAALVCVLSVYNGYTRMILSSDDESSAEYVLAEVQGRDFEAKPLLSQLKQCKTSLIVAQELTTQGVLQASGENFPVRVCGLDPAYTQIIKLDSQLYQGDYLRFRPLDSLPDALIGIGLLQDGAMNQVSSDDPHLIFPKRQGFINPLAPASAFEERTIHFTGIVNPLTESLNKSVFIDIKVLQDLLKLPEGTVSSLLISPQSPVSESALRQELKSVLGDRYKLMNREEQQPGRTFLIKSEKIMVYLIMVFILVLAAFNLSSSLVMLMIEKRQNIHALSALGASIRQITLAFTTTGVLTSLIGSTLGLVLGLGICLAQQHFALLYTGEGMSRLPFPVEVQASDLSFIMLITLLISSISASLPSFFLRSLIKSSG